jgi:hypothetical protein
MLYSVYSLNMTLFFFHCRELGEWGGEWGGGGIYHHLY